MQGVITLYQRLTLVCMKMRINMIVPSRVAGHLQLLEPGTCCELSSQQILLLIAGGHHNSLTS